MNFKLSKLLNANIEKIKHFSTKQEIDVFIKRLIIDNNLKQDKSAIILINQLKKSKDFNNSLMVVWNMVMSQNGAFLGKEIEKKCWFKGTSIHGMECHSQR